MGALQLLCSRFFNFLGQCPELDQPINLNNFGIAVLRALGMNFTGS